MGSCLSLGQSNCSLVLFPYKQPQWESQMTWVVEKNIYKCFSFDPKETCWAISIFLHKSLAGGGEGKLFTRRVELYVKLSSGMGSAWVIIKAVLKNSKPSSPVVLMFLNVLFPKTLHWSLPMHRIYYTFWSSLKVQISFWIISFSYHLQAHQCLIWSSSVLKMSFAPYIFIAVGGPWGI